MGQDMGAYYIFSGIAMLLYWALLVDFAETRLSRNVRRFVRFVAVGFLKEDWVFPGFSTVFSWVLGPLSCFVNPSG